MNIVLCNYIHLYIYPVASGSKRIDGGKHTKPEVNVVETKELL